MSTELSSKLLFSIGQNQFKISRTDYYNKSCNAFFRWFRTDAQVLFLAEKIASNLLDRSDIFGKEIRMDFDIKEEGTYALYLTFSKKAETFYDIKLFNFIKASKIKENDATQSIPLEGYKYVYKLVPRDSDHFYAASNFEGLRYRICFSSHLIFKKEHFFKKYNFQRLASDVLKYMVLNNMAETLADGTPLRVKVKPTIENEAVNHTLHVTCSYWYDSNAKDTIPYVFLVDSVRYLSLINQAANADNFLIDEVFELNTVKALEQKEKPKGLKIVKKKSLS